MRGADPQPRRPVLATGPDGLVLTAWVAGPLVSPARSTSWPSEEFLGRHSACYPAKSSPDRGWCDRRPAPSAAKSFPRPSVMGRTSGPPQSPPWGGRGPAR